MKAKNSLMAMLWLLISALFKMKNRLFVSKNPGKFKTNSLSLELQKVCAESKRITEKLQETKQLKDAGITNTQYPGVLPLPENKPLEPDEEDEELVVSRWREDEEDRARSNDYEFWNYRQNLLRADHPDIMEGNLLALFKADHDAAQYEQYKLENERVRPEEETVAVSHLRQFLSSGFNFLFTVIFLLGAASHQVKAQDFEFEEPEIYTVGDRVPNFTIDNLLNSEKQSISLSDYKGKLLIIDFWATWCDFSTSLFNKEDSLEKKFNGKAAFLPVSYQSREEINRFLTILRKNSPESLPGKEVLVAVGDQTLRRMFPHVSLPHFIWIGPDGIIKAITGFEDLNEANIAKVLSGQPLNVRIKKEIRIPYDPEKPILLANNGGDGSNMFYHSVFTKYTEGLGGVARFYKNDPVKGGKITISNFNIRNLYKFALGNGSLNFADNRIVYEVKDPGRINSNKTGGEYDDWMKRDNGFCYELIVPPPISSGIFKLMVQDLDRVFPQYDVRLEKRDTKCLALVRTSKVDKLKSKNGKADLRVEDFEFSLTNGHLYNFLGPLNAFYLQSNPLPVIDETGYTANVDLQINASLKDVAALNRELAKYDLQFIETVKNIEIIVFRDRKI